MVLKAGIVGTGYAASRRAETIIADPRSELVAFTGNTPEAMKNFSQTYSVSMVDSWQKLVSLQDLDIVFICNINELHGKIAYAALEASKHVVLEYPLSLEVKEAQEIIALAKSKGKLLHIEHIELLGGVHQAIAQYLPEIGEVFSARYCTISPQKPVPRKWTYHREMFGFPLIGALSRLHRFTDLFGSVASVSCQARFWDALERGYFTSCYCQAQLLFTNGLIAEVVYGKGEVFSQGDRTFSLNGEKGSLIFEGETGFLVRGEEKTPLEVGTRRGLFTQDTILVLDFLSEGKPLYVDPEASYYTLKVACAAQESAKTGLTVFLT